ncbi:MAG: hypothetical protein Kow0098_20540 [Ignavibacteriaceae bacterium]
MLLKFLEQVKKPGFPEDQFAVFGSGPMAVRNLRIPNDIDLIVKARDIIDGIRYVKLEYLYKWKKEMNRQKDRSDLLMIYNYLKRDSSSVL